MAESPSFFTYPSPGFEAEAKKACILFRLSSSGWTAVNRTTLEIALQLDRGASPDQVAGKLAAEYSIPFEAARKDVLYVAHQLGREGFLGATAQTLLQRRPSLQTAFLHVTTRCNLTCPQCYAAQKSDDLPPPLAMRLIGELEDLGARAVSISGGEPLLYPDIRNLLKRASQKMSIRLLTNGTLIDRDWALFLADMNVFVQLSVDGSTPEIHDAIRGRGNFLKTMRALKHLQDVELGQRVNFSTTVMRHNIHDLAEIVRLAEALEVPLVRFLPVRKVGRAVDEWEFIGSGLSAKDSEDFYHYASELQRTHKTPIGISCGLSGFMLKIPAESAEDDIWCPVGKQLVISVNGDTFPCVLLMRDNFKLGSVHSASLAEMLHSEAMTRTCRTLCERRSKIAKCAACHWRNLCQGGCMGQALDHRETVWDVDDFCDYRKKAYEKAFERVLDDFEKRTS